MCRSIDEATPSSLGRGIHGAPPGEEAHGGTHESVGRHNELDGEQMRAPGEGDVADIVDKKPGATGEQVDLAADLDRYVLASSRLHSPHLVVRRSHTLLLTRDFVPRRKKAEQASQRSPAPSEEQGVDVQDVLRNR